MASSSYTQKHEQPFSLSEAIDLDVGLLSNEITRLRNSIGHLQTSNQELRSFIEDPENADDVDGLDEVIQENEQVIEVQQDRIELIKAALEQKIGTDPANTHYDSRPQEATETAAEEANRMATDENTEHGSSIAEHEEEGLYL